MSRELLVASRIDTTTYGTVTHMPPELLSSGQLSAATDVYSFGVILNEMYCGACRVLGLQYPSAAVEKLSSIVVNETHMPHARPPTSRFPPALKGPGLACPGVRAWASMAPPQVLHAVAVQGRRPQFPPGTPPEFVVRLRTQGLEACTLSESRGPARGARCFRHVT